MSAAEMFRQIELEEAVRGVHRAVEAADRSRGEAILLAGAIMARDPRRYREEMEGGLREKLMEKWGPSRAHAFDILAQAFALLLCRDEDGEFVRLFSEAAMSRPSSGMDRYHRILNTIQLWAMAIGTPEEGERAEELRRLLEMWRDLPYQAFRAATVPRGRHQEAETEVNHLPSRAVFRIYPILEDGRRDDAPIDVIIRWAKAEHEAVARRVIGHIQRLVEDLGEVQLREPHEPQEFD